MYNDLILTMYNDLKLTMYNDLNLFYIYETI